MGHDDRTAEIDERTAEMALGRLRLLVMWEGQTVAADLPLVGELRIGRGKQCDVVVDHASVSRTHVALAIEGGGIRVRDLGSRNGTKVNGQKLAEGEAAPFRPGVLVEMGRALMLLQPRDAMRAIHEPPDGAPLPALDGFVVPASGPMREVYRLVSHVAKSKLSVLLLGETGSGKEVVAEAVHRWSPRASGPFVRLNCGALTESLLESELFGHEKGAFTGALQTKAGLIETADGGTLFLDEIGEMPLATQAKVLRVLEAREVLRVGALKPRAVDLRLVAATHRDLDAAMRTGAFRSDLFYRINGVSVVIPPLRSRANEITELAAAFARRACADSGRAPVTFSEEALAALKRHAWPGNVRELRNVVERAVALCPGDVVGPSHLGDRSFDPGLVNEPAAPSDAGAAGASTGSLADDISAIEKARILDALEKAGGNQSEAARVLGLPRRTLVRRLQEWGLTKPRK